MVSKLEALCFEKGGEKAGILEAAHANDPQIPISRRIALDEAKERVRRQDINVMFRTETPFGFRAFHGMFFSVVPGRGLYNFEVGSAHHPVPFDLEAIERIIRLEEIGDEHIDILIKDKRNQLNLYCSQRGYNVDQVMRNLTYSIWEFYEHQLKGIIFQHPNIKEAFFILTDKPACAFRVWSDSIQLIDVDMPSIGIETFSKYGDELLKAVSLHRRAISQSLFPRNISIENEFGILPTFLHQFRYFKQKNYQVTDNIHSSRRLSFGKTPNEGVEVTYNGRYSFERSEINFKSAEMIEKGRMNGKFAYYVVHGNQICTYLPNAAAILFPFHLSAFVHHGERSALSMIPYTLFLDPKQTDPNQKLTDLESGDKLRIKVESGCSTFERVG